MRLTDEKKLTEYLRYLDPREEQILRMYWGFGEEQQYSAEEIAERFQLTKARIYGIIQIANRIVKVLFIQDHGLVRDNEEFQAFEDFCQRLNLR